ncbi:Golgi membrane protein 1 isoform X2 [Austrofundulus limnaeus]|uniref:Golgi membrane protein 1 isoform X2 n=1 Tax=Austrofundulus limnaeus TaxID=52670 RepID=A0A2I4C8B3_AUSLI|nr:PREDICTED: Golgi membrane protein 1 isoform X2 [Austrofundulus limnaeus]
MGGLGNGRRGVRSPPLMIAALIACILVLGFNYWVSSSRNLELQTKLYELEGRVQRGAAEREMKKSEFQEVQKQKDEIQKQKDEIQKEKAQIESFYKTQMDGAQVTCSQDKAKLQQNVSSSTKTIQDLKGHLNQLNDDLGKLQKELQSCQGNINSLNKKLMYDMTQCESKIQTEKELCDEKMSAAKLEVQKKTEKLSPLPDAPSQKNTGKEMVKEGTTVNSEPSGNPTAVVNHTSSSPQPKGNKNPDSLTNDIIIDQDSGVFGRSPTKDLSKAETQSVSEAASLKQNKLQLDQEDVRTDETEIKTNKDVKKNLNEIKGVEVMEAREEGAQRKEADPGMEDMLIDQGNPDEPAVGQKLEDQEEYDADEQVVGGVDVERGKQAENIDKDMEEELADYNGDDENEGEFEADKQEALAQI